MSNYRSIRGRDSALMSLRGKLKAAREENTLLRRYVTALESLAVRSMDNCPKKVRRLAKLKKEVAP